MSINGLRLCEHCAKKRFVCGSAFTTYVCQKCGKEFLHHNTCIPKICKECSIKYNICQRCGTKLNCKGGDVNGKK